MTWSQLAAEIRLMTPEDREKPVLGVEPYDDARILPLVLATAIETRIDDDGTALTIGDPILICA